MVAVYFCCWFVYSCLRLWLSARFILSISNGEFILLLSLKFTDNEELSIVHQLTKYVASFDSLMLQLPIAHSFGCEKLGFVAGARKAYSIYEPAHDGIITQTFVHIITGILAHILVIAGFVLCVLFSPASMKLWLILSIWSYQ